MLREDLKSAETHFRFGENWASFANLLTKKRVDLAIASLCRLIPEGISGKSFLDIGSGSGLSALAALQIGAGPLVACDIDSKSVETTESVLREHSPSPNFLVRQLSVFDLSPETFGRFDVVHSWGVLHHTGSMWEAIEKAAALVAPEGLLVLAIYLRTPFCFAWKIEKRLYVNAPKSIQNWIFHLYRTTARLYLRARGRDPKVEWETHQFERGMDQDHDIRDWLGGYPYESASPKEVDDLLVRKGFVKVRSLQTEARMGLMGTGCAEYVYRRTAIDGCAGRP